MRAGAAVVATSLGWLAACGGSPPAPVSPVSPVSPVPADAATAVPAGLSPALAPLAWWLGDWQGDDGSEHWIAVGGALYGIALQTTGMFEVMIVDDGDGPGPADGVVRLIAMPGGARAVEFREDRSGPRSITFANPAHDAPRTISYERTDAGLRATLDVDGQRAISFAFRPGSRTVAPELEAADRAFDAATTAGGADGWAAAFAANGAMMRQGARIEGAAIADAMRSLLADGTLRWAPIASHRVGDLGFTIGQATYTAAAPAESWLTTYATIWRRQPDGRWLVEFDVGRVVNDP